VNVDHSTIISSAGGMAISPGPGRAAAAEGVEGGGVGKEGFCSFAVFLQESHKIG